MPGLREELQGMFMHSDATHGAGRDLESFLLFHHPGLFGGLVLFDLPAFPNSTSLSFFEYSLSLVTFLGNLNRGFDCLRISQT